MPEWMTIAESYIGLKELPGRSLHNPTILGWLKRYALNIGKWGKSRDETPYCAAFVSHCLESSGHRSTRHGLAVKYADWGKQSTLKKGAIVVIRRKRGPNTTGSGRGGYHVAFLWKWDKRFIWLLGGNQRNKVGINAYSKKNYDIIAVRWPRDDDRVVSSG